MRPDQVCESTPKLTLRPPPTKTRVDENRPYMRRCCLLEMFCLSMSTPHGPWLYLEKFGLRASVFTTPIIKDFSEAQSEMAAMIRDGGLKVKEERFEGVEAMPEAFCGLFKGENFGRRVVKVGEEP